MTKRQIPPGMELPDSYDREGLKRIAYRLNRPVSTLIVLSPQNDPFYISPTRQDDAEWFAKVWRKFIGDDTGVHLRRLHYKLVSQKKPVPMRNGTPYENSDACWQALCATSKDARYLNLVPVEAFIDRRNPEAVINIRDTGTPTLSTESGDLDMPEEMPDLPELVLDMREPAQRYQIEIWAEKTTMNDILEPLGERYGIHVVTGAGELSVTACDLFIKRAEAAADRPLRILYVSDFDPAGRSMPVAVARKIEFMIYDASLDLDVQVRPVVLTPEQCEQYELPRTPIKDSERRADAFEERHGEGATELDALEALHPGVLAEILEREIVRYWDDELEQATEEEANPVRDQLKRINAKVRKANAKQIAELEAEYAEVVAAHADWAAHGLDAEAPDLDAVDWPEPEDGDEDDDPLFDSTREYVEQVDRYKEFQGKPIARKPGTGGFRPGGGRPRKKKAGKKK